MNKFKLFWRKIKDKDAGSLIAMIWSISWPMTVIMLFVFLIDIADVFVAGRISKEVQAAYGFTSQLYFIFSIIAFALTVGAVSVISRLFTSPKKEDLSLAVYSSVVSSGLAGALFSLIALIFSRDIITSLNIPHTLKDQAAALMRIYSVGILFNYLLINTNGIMRSCGMIKRSLWTMGIVCFLNIVLNLLLSLRTPLGFRGIAIATVISSAIGCGLNLYYLKKITFGKIKLSPYLTRRIISVGWPAGLLQVFWQLAALALFLILSALPEHNVEILAAFTNGLKIEAAIFLPAFAFNLAAAVVVGNLLGKNNKEAAFTGGIVTSLLGVLIVSVMSGVIMFNAWRIAPLLSDNDLVIRESVRYIRIALLFEPLMAWGVILAGCLNGSGDTKSVMLFVVLSVWLVRVPLSYLLGIYLNLGPVAVWWSMNLSILIQSALISRRYFSKQWLNTLPPAPPS